MTTLDKVRALFEVDAVLETVDNTYRPQLNGSRRQVVCVGRGYFRYRVLDGVHANECGHSDFPKRARDVLEVTADSVTYRLDGPAARGEHTLTLRRVAA